MRLSMLLVYDVWTYSLFLDNTVTMYVYIACQQIVAANEWGIFENVLIDILGRI